MVASLPNYLKEMNSLNFLFACPLPVAEKGCHVLHILSSVRRRYSQNLSRPALETALRVLETTSDIISTSDAHYTVV